MPTTFICESLDDFDDLPRWLPQKIVSIDKYLNSDVSGQLWQVFRGEMVVVPIVNREDTDRTIPLGNLDCNNLEVRINLNLGLVSI